MNKLIFLLILCGCHFLPAQKKVLLPLSDTLPYDRKEEIIFDGNRYRIHNNYLTLNFAFLGSSIRDNGQKSVGADYQFHIRRHSFQIGAMMSGEEFLSNNNNEFHFGYGLRKENGTSNLAAYVGASYFRGVEGIPPAPASLYDGFGGYISLQAVYKFKYDIGIGFEVFGDFSYKQSLAGVKLILFFSGAYRGVKKKYNPNVRSERPK